MSLLWDAASPPALSRSHSEPRRSEVPVSIALALPLSWTRSAEAQELLLCPHESQLAQVAVGGGCVWSLGVLAGVLACDVGCG